MAVHEASRRILVFAAVAFFITSTYLCATRLYDTSFTREAPQQSNEPTEPTEPQNQVLHLGVADYPMSYGKHKRPDMDGLTLMANLPDQFIPTFKNKRRLIVVGDIHGMDKSLAALLEEVNFDVNTDHLVATGDMINKGPDSPGVISRLMKLGASAVRGNHEDRVLLALAEAESQTGVSKEVASPDDGEHRGESSFLATGRKLSREHVAWLSQLPVILAVEPLSMYIVHAGLVPGVRPELQDPWAVMNMRTIVYPREDLRKREHIHYWPVPPPAPQNDQHSRSDEEADDGEGHTEEKIQAQDHFTDHDIAIPVDGRDGEKWANAWNRYQKRLKKNSRHTVVYGHDAKRGYREGKYTFGLDSGCVSGGALTALIVEGAKGGGFKQKTLQVRCKKH